MGVSSAEPNIKVGELYCLAENDMVRYTYDMSSYRPDPWNHSHIQQVSPQPSGGKVCQNDHDTEQVNSSFVILWVIIEKIAPTTKFWLGSKQCCADLCSDFI